MSLRDRTDAENWAALSADPLAYIRELAYAHAEKLQAIGDVAVLDLSGCPTCGGALIYEVANPSSARCVSCAEPLRRLGE